jgi:hypothetical protein
MKPTHSVTLLLPAALAFAFAAGPDDARADTQWTFGGFGTLSAVHSTEKEADYTASQISRGSAGYTHDWAFDVDTRLGAQLGAQFDKRWSAVVQVVEERAVDGRYRPRLEWANVKYQVTPELSVRAGRIALPLFLTADYRKASYALPWLRTPVELYILMPISNSDGIDASLRWHAWGTKQETQAIVGRSSVHMTEDVAGTSENVLGLTHTATIGALTLRGTVAQSRLKVEAAQPLFDAFRAFGAPGRALADRYDFSSRRVYVLSGGFSYDPGRWFLMGEVGRVDTRSLLGDQTGGYLSGGWRFGSVTPYATFARVETNMETSSPGVPVAGLPPAAARTALALNAGLNSWLSSIAEQSTASAGVRWDFAPNYAFKLQVDRVRPRGGTSGTLTNLQPGYRIGHPFGVASVAIDFVF